MNTQKNTINPYAQAHDEMILVVKRTDIFPLEAWHGLMPVNETYFTNLVREKKLFMPRSVMEQDPTYKQIIPYLVFKFEDKYFLMQRKAKATESRLQSKFTLGIGGHIREEDMTSDDLRTWAHREFEEEVAFEGTYAVKPLGLLNDDTNAVGEVHVGFVYLIEGTSANISVKEELQSGSLMTLEEINKCYDRMETWSQIVFDYLWEEKHEGKRCCC